MTPPPTSPDAFHIVKHMSKGDVRCKIAEHVYRSGYRWTARKHLLLRYRFALAKRLGLARDAQREKP